MAKEATNAVVTVEDGKVVIRIDPDMRIGPSSSGKTMLIASGNLAVPGHPQMKITVSAYTKDKS